MELYLKYRHDNDPQLKSYYIKYCKLLTQVIREAKKAYYNSIIRNSHNKIKTTWSVIKKETGNKIYKDEPQLLKINNIRINNKVHIANAFNEYFTSVAQTIVDDRNKDNNKNMTDNPLYYLNNMSNFNFEAIKWHYISTTEISKIIKSLKTKSSYEYDEISSRMLKASMPFIISPLISVINPLHREFFRID
jgi:hypothetical protein